MKRLFLYSPLALSLCFAVTQRACADVKLPSIIASHMVLQQEKPLPIWGWADPGEEVTVQFGDKTEKTAADDKGNWKVTLPAQKADNKPRRLVVVGKIKIELTDILIGEVWVGSGQSNMEWNLKDSTGAKSTIAAANYPEIRLFQVPKVQNKAPAKDVKATWEVCSPKTVGRFSGVLFHFGLRLQKELGVPIGLINSSWGGSSIDPWIIGEKQSGGMYNGMIAPLQPFAIRGTTWYQGEAQVGTGMKYRDKMEALIQGWRKIWGNDMPFYFVQLAPWSGYKEAGALPGLWEAQVASLKIPGTGMAVVTDLVDNIAEPIIITGVEIEGAESVGNFDNFQLNPNQPVTRGMRVYFRGKAPKGTEDYAVQLVFKDLRGNRYPTVEHRFKPLPIPERVDIQRGHHLS